MSVAYHLAAISAGKVSKTNVIGIRKILNTAERADDGLSVSCTATKATAAQLGALQKALTIHHPTVVGELHHSGLKILKSPRYRKRFEKVQHIIDHFDRFELAGFEFFDRYHSVPIYRVVSTGGNAFCFRNVAWQSGGNGPEII